MELLAEHAILQLKRFLLCSNFVKMQKINPLGIFSIFIMHLVHNSNLGTPWLFNFWPQNNYCTTSTLHFCTKNIYCNFATYTYNGPKVTLVAVS